jgi:hypothetical protein
MFLFEFGTHHFEVCQRALLQQLQEGLGEVLVDLDVVEAELLPFVGFVVLSLKDGNTVRPVRTFWNY